MPTPGVSAFTSCFQGQPLSLGAERGGRTSPGDGLGDMPCEGRQHWDHAEGAHPVQDPMLGGREVSVTGPLLGGSPLLTQGGKRSLGQSRAPRLAKLPSLGL